MHDYFDRLEAQLGALLKQGAHRRGIGRLVLPRIGGVVALVASTVIVVGVTAAALSAGGSRRPAVSGGHHASTSEIDGAMVRSFKILRRPRHSSDRLPRALAGVGVNDAALLPAPSWQPNPASLGLLPALARRAIIPGTGFSVWLIPGRRGLCWDARDQSSPLLGGICGRFRYPAIALTDGGGIAYDRGVTVGLVTDRVVSLELVDGAGRQRAVPLSEGFYAASYRRGDRLIAITRTGRHDPLPIANLPETVGRSMPVPGTIIDQIDLQPPSGAHTPEGTAWIDQTSGRVKLWVTPAGIKPNSSTNAYAVWLAGGPSGARMLGFAATVGPDGQLGIASVLPTDAAHGRQLLVTNEKTGVHPKQPGTIVLQGRLSL